MNPDCSIIQASKLILYKYKYVFFCPTQILMEKQTVQPHEQQEFWVRKLYRSIMSNYRCDSTEFDIAL